MAECMTCGRAIVGVIGYCSDTCAEAAGQKDCATCDQRGSREQCDACFMCLKSEIETEKNERKTNERSKRH